MYNPYTRWPPRNEANYNDMGKLIEEHNFRPFYITMVKELFKEINESQCIIDDLLEDKDCILECNKRDIIIAFEEVRERTHTERLSLLISKFVLNDGYIDNELYPELVNGLLNQVIENGRKIILLEREFEEEGECGDD